MRVSSRARQILHKPRLANPLRHPLYPHLPRPLLKVFPTLHRALHCDCPLFASLINQDRLCLLSQIPPLYYNRNPINAAHVILLQAVAIKHPETTLKCCETQYQELHHLLYHSPTYRVKCPRSESGWCRMVRCLRETRATLLALIAESHDLFVRPSALGIAAPAPELYQWIQPVSITDLLLHRAPSPLARARRHARNVSFHRTMRHSSAL